MKKRKPKRRRTYRAPKVTSEPIFERYALMCASKDPRNRNFIT